MDSEMEMPEYVVSSTEFKTKILSQHEKFKKASLLVKDLPILVAEKSNDLYLQRMENLRDLCDAYRNGDEVMIVKVNSIFVLSLEQKLLLIRGFALISSAIFPLLARSVDDSPAVPALADRDTLPPPSF
ncbi:Protein of unknown function [Cotesia congregata]|uniref:Uncharacterized protein n=1 Tax=Cotesia congregata TaxID=51543 RepID=A0A8J2EGX3_COTCN|nr:Protein of unknown function [Cotesia congregata]